MADFTTSSIEDLIRDMSHEEQMLALDSDPLFSDLVDDLRLSPKDRLDALQDELDDLV